MPRYNSKGLTHEAPKSIARSRATVSNTERARRRPLSGTLALPPWAYPQHTTWERRSRSCPCRSRRTARTIPSPPASRCGGTGDDEKPPVASQFATSTRVQSTAGYCFSTGSSQFQSPWVLGVGRRGHEVLDPGIGLGVTVIAVPGLAGARAAERHVAVPIGVALRRRVRSRSAGVGYERGRIAAR